VIPSQPDFRQVGKTVVVSDEFGREVAVIVEDRLPFGEIVVEIPRRRAVEQKVLVNEGFHGQWEMSASIASRDA